MSSEAINIVLNLSQEGVLLNFSVQTVGHCEGLTEIECSSDSSGHCPNCACQISLFTRVLKTEVLSENDEIPDQIKEEAEAQNLQYLEVDEKLLIPEELPDTLQPRIPTKKQTSKFSKSSGPLRCLHCNGVFRDAIYLSAHHKHFGIIGGESEPVPDAVKCDKHCRRYFANEEELQKHLNEYRKPRRTYKCDVCSTVFTVQRTYRTHLLSHGPVKCHKCEVTLTDTFSYHKHMATHVQSSAHRCEVCHRGLDSEEGLLFHTRWMHEKDRNCSFCGKSFTQWQMLQAHENNHKNIQPFQCHLCGAGFVRNVVLKLHMERSHQGRVYICDHCGQTYKTRISIRDHFQSHHIESPTIFECSICPKGKQFKVLSAYKAHMKRHRKGKQFPCRICGKRFQDQNWLRKHVEANHMELGERTKYQCGTCGKVMLTKSSLSIHLNSHKVGGEFKCQICSKSMSSLYNLRAHEKIHTDERPFTCQTCGKSFRNSDTLKTHIRHHTGEKPYECPVEECKKRFSDRGCFRSHLVVHEKQMNVKLIKKRYYLNDS